MESQSTLKRLKEYFHNNDHIILAILFGSRAKKSNKNSSDWDFAIQLESSISGIDALGMKEVVRNDLSRLLNWESENLDLVDIANVGLSLASTIVEEGIVLKGDGSLELSRFYTRIWALEEDFFWGLKYENRTLSS